jgi:hypothetical protein
VGRQSRVAGEHEQQHVNKYRRNRLISELVEAGYRSVTVTTAVGLAPFAAVFGPGPVRWLHALEARLGHLGCGNLLLAVAAMTPRPESRSSCPPTTRPETYRCSMTVSRKPCRPILD